jgi:hypothetical protein
VLDLLTGLVDKSLVVVEPPGSRYRLLDTIRRYARERLAAEDDLPARERRHALYFLSLAAAAEPALRGPAQIEWLSRLDAEHDNLRAALTWSVASGERGRAVQAAGALYLFWMQRHVGEGRELLARLLDADEPIEPLVRSRALATAGALAGVQADHLTARGLLEAAVAAAEPLGDSSELALALLGLGAIDSFDGDVRCSVERIVGIVCVCLC